MTPTLSPEVKPRARQPAPIEAGPREAVHIGRRWHAGFIERRDTETGTYEAVNSPLLAVSEELVQRALLTPVRDKGAAQRLMAAQTAQRCGRAVR